MRYQSFHRAEQLPLVELKATQLDPRYTILVSPAQTTGLGGAGAEMELVDSQTGKRIWATIDNQKGARLSKGAGLTWYGHAEQVMENWAKDLKKWVDQTHGKF